jgi:hypothetical protein
MVNFNFSNKKEFKADIANFMKRRDLFGVPIGLTYEYYQVHRTVLSGSLSLLLRMYMVYFAASTYIKIYSGSTENINSQFMQFNISQ